MPAVSGRVYAESGNQLTDALPFREYRGVSLRI
jgi:hypothetical protein